MNKCRNEQKTQNFSQNDVPLFAKEVCKLRLFFWANLSGCQMLRGKRTTRNLLTKVLLHGQGFCGFFYRTFWWVGQLVTIVTFQRIVIVGAYHVLNYFFLSKLLSNGDTIDEHVIGKSNDQTFYGATALHRAAAYAT